MHQMPRACFAVRFRFWKVLLHHRAAELCCIKRSRSSLIGDKGCETGKGDGRVVTEGETAKVRAVQQSAIGIGSRL